MNLEEARKEIDLIDDQIAACSGSGRKPPERASEDAFSCRDDSPADCSTTRTGRNPAGRER